MMKDTGKMLLALVAGAAIGTAIGILLAPRKGDETRKDIMDAADELASSLKDKLKETTDAIDDLKERFFDGKESAQSTGKSNGHTNS